MSGTARADLLQRGGAAVAAIGTPAFAAALTALVRSTAPYTYTVIFGYCGAARPVDLHDDFPEDRYRVFVTDYQDGPYLLDPFFLAARQNGPTGLHRMRDLAPDRFYQGEYFRSYYVRTGLAEEVGYFVALPRGARVVLSLMRDERPFSARNLRDLAELYPLIEACVHRHWGDLADLFSAKVPASTDAAENRIEQSFQSFGQGVLTPREREVVEYTLKGHSAEATGRILGISPGTVRIHRRNIYAKLQIGSQGELFSRFIQTLSRP